VRSARGGCSLVVRLAVITVYPCWYTHCSAEAAHSLQAVDAGMGWELPLKVGQLSHIGVQVAFEGCATHVRVVFALYVGTGSSCCVTVHLRILPHCTAAVCRQHCWCVVLAASLMLWSLYNHPVHCWQPMAVEVGQLFVLPAMISICGSTFKACVVWPGGTV